MNKYLLWLIIISLFLSSCKKELFQFNFSEKNKLMVQEMDYESLQAKSKITYDDGIKKINANATFRLRKDSIIWVSISPAIGVEAARAVITQDSVYFLDRMNKTFTVFSIDSLQKQFNIYIDFKMLESSLVGNLLFIRNDKNKVTKNEDFYILSQNEHNLEINNFVSPATMKIQKISVLEKPLMNSLDIDYSDFQVIENGLIPFEKIFLVKYSSGKSNKNTLLEISFNKVSINDKKIKFPLNIPGKYVSH